MAKIRRESIKDQVYGIVKSRIFNGEYEFGETIKISELSKELGASNTPIREALSMLAAEGLLTASLNNKFRVIDLNEEKMKDLNEVVLVVLLGAYRQAHSSGKDSVLPALMRKALAEQEAALESGDNDKYVSKAMAFDRCFVLANENSMLLDIFDKYTGMLELCVRQVMKQDSSSEEKGMEEHRQMIDAAEAGDIDRMEKILEEHYNKHFTAQGSKSA